MLNLTMDRIISSADITEKQKESKENKGGKTKEEKGRKGKIKGKETMDSKTIIITKLETETTKDMTSSAIKVIKVLIIIKENSNRDLKIFKTSSTL
jgi:hypothetical protein